MVSDDSDSDSTSSSSEEEEIEEITTEGKKESYLLEYYFKNAAILLSIRYVTKGV